MGLAMGVTAVSIIYSRWGQRSGAHMNPAVTLTYFRLGKVAPADTRRLRRGPVYRQRPRDGGGLRRARVSSVEQLGALRGHASWSQRNCGGVPGRGHDFLPADADGVVRLPIIVTGRVSPACAPACWWTYITVEAPLSGMSMNPARTVGSALLRRTSARSGSTSLRRRSGCCWRRALRPTIRAAPHRLRQAAPPPGGGLHLRLRGRVSRCTRGGHGNSSPAHGIEAARHRSRVGLHDLNRETRLPP